MVERQIVRRGVRDPRVLDAMRRVPRERFVPLHLRDAAYDDAPLPIGEGQTISQPLVVALMIEALKLRGGEKALEVGAGSGYAAAVLAEIAGEVYAIERIEALAEEAKRRLAEAGCENARLRCADGTKGWPEAAPFDAILVSAGGPEAPKSLLGQLAIGGRLVMPIGKNAFGQELVRITRVSEDDFERDDLGRVSFVPLIGEEGWRDEDSPRGLLRRLFFSEGPVRRLRRRDE